MDLKCRLCRLLTVLLYSFLTVLFDSAFVFDDVDDIIETLQLLLNQVLNEYIPVKQKRVRKVKQLDWFNDRIINAIKLAIRSSRKRGNQMIQTTGQNINVLNVLLLT